MGRRDPDRYHVLRMHDYFYYKEHLFLVTELLKDNLYEYSRFIRHSGAEPYFTLPRHAGSKGAVTIMRAKKTTLKHRMHVQDDVFVDFVESLLTYDQMARPSALDALKHPWLADNNCDVEQFHRGLLTERQTRDTGSTSSVLRGSSKKIPPKRMLSSKGKV